MFLSVIIPVYNEASTLAELLRRVHEVNIPKEVLVVDDGSDEATKILLGKSASDNVTLITHPHNMGKGTAIRTGLAHATGDVVIIQDADLEYFPSDYVNLMAMYRTHRAKVVYGQRDLSRRSMLMRQGNRLMTWATNILYGVRLHDMETCYKLIDRQLMQSLNLESRRFEIEAEITAKIIRSGNKIYETPIQYDHREEGKKLTPLDGWPTLQALLRYRFWRPQPVVAVADKPVEGRTG
ncbi:MAG: glycosyltransferase family 2 protein [Chloroflexi bacterium]|nr:glycosyltransferase family 2 protein [Chloroflexota bacterium]MBP8057367.1 glycosyltransferase family 2 protein [Chloroflexota bacterium]